MLREPLPVVPAAHYLCGGVLTDTHGRSTLPGLYAVGETACTGVHGANRLASNSLLEALVFAERAAAALAAGDGRRDRGGSDPVSPPAAGTEALEGALLVHDRDEIRNMMWDLVGIVRTDERLALAGERLRQISSQYQEIWTRHAPSPDLVELRNLIQVALLIVEAAASRKESRGLHFNPDHPYRDNERFLRDTILQAP